MGKLFARFNQRKAGSWDDAPMTPTIVLPDGDPLMAALLNYLAVTPINIVAAIARADLIRNYLPLAIMLFRNLRLTNLS